MSDAQLEGLLRDRGQRVTSQRVILLEALRESGRHTTAEKLHELAAHRLPMLSLPTVYATLELFERLGLIRRINSGPGPAIYDPVLDGHAHLSCAGCGALIDIPAPIDLSGVIEAAAREGHAPMTAELVIAGTCKSCQAPVG